MKRIKWLIVAAFLTIQAMAGENECSYFFQEAMRLKASQQYAEAFDLLRHCHAIDPTDAGTLYELSPYYRGMNDMATYLAYLEEAHRQDPDNYWITLQLASAWKEAQDLNRASQLIAEIIADDPNESDLYYPLAQMYAELKDYKSAIHAFDKLENAIGVRDDITLAKCHIYETMGQPSKAIKEFERLARTQPDNAHTQLTLASVYLSHAGEDKKGKMEEKALSIINSSIKENPNSGECLMALADYYLKTGNDKGLEQQLTAVIDSPKVDIETKLRSLQYFVKQTPEDSVFVHQSFLKVLEQYPEEYTIHQMYVIWLMQHNEKELSKEELRNVLDMNPDQVEVWEDYMTLYLQDNDVDNVERISEEALGYFPDHKAFWYYLAISKSIRKDYPNAIEAYLKAAQNSLQGDEAFKSECYGNIGDIYHELGDTVTSYTYYDEALRYNPNNVLVLNNYAYFLCLQGESLEQAEQMSRRAVKIEATNSTYLDTYAWVCFKQGKYSIAKAYMERAFVNLKESNPEISEHYGDILWFCGEKEAAAAQWIEAYHLSSEPSDVLKLKAESGDYYE